MNAKGADISKHQDWSDLTKPSGVNFEVLLSKVDFLIVRAGYAGLSLGVYQDERLDEYMPKYFSAVKKVKGKSKMPFTFYWFWRNREIQGQVDKFSAIVNKYKGAITLPLVVDAEAGWGTTPSKNVDALALFKSGVESQTSLKVDIMYTRQSAFDKNTLADCSKLFPYLFAARYSNDLTSPWSDGYYKFRDWANWDIWQWSADGNMKGAEHGCPSNSIDLDWFNGTVAELEAWANLEDPQKEFASMIEKIEFDITNDSVSLFAISDEPFRIKGVELAGPKGSIQYINAYFHSNGENVRVLRKYVISSTKTWIEFPLDVVVEPGQYVEFLLEPVKDDEKTKHTLKVVKA